MDCVLANTSEIGTSCLFYFSPCWIRLLVPVRSVIHSGVIAETNIILKKSEIQIFGRFISLIAFILVFSNFFSNTGFAKTFLYLIMIRQNDLSLSCCINNFPRLATFTTALFGLFNQIIECTCPIDKLNYTFIEFNTRFNETYKPFVEFNRHYAEFCNTFAVFYKQFIEFNNAFIDYNRRLNECY
jgi:hypothetical protein